MRLGWVALLAFGVVVAAPVIPYDDGEPDISPSTEDEIATNITDRVNDARANRSLGQLERSGRLDGLARAHAQDMAALGYVGHINSDEEDIRDRYRDAGLLPECRLPTGGGRYYYGTELANQVTAGSEVLRSGIGGEPVEVTTPPDAAAVTVAEFLASPEHQQALLLPAADEIGVAVAVDGDKVYIVVELC